MNLKQFLLNEDKYDNIKEKFMEEFPDLYVHKDITKEDFSNLRNDKNALFSFGNGSMWDMSLEAIDKTKRKVYIKDYTWSHDVIIPKLLKFGRKHNIVFKLITEQDVEPETPWNQIGGLVVAFKSTKLKGRFDKEMVVEAKTPEFKVGDRVIAIGDMGRASGKKGTIVHLHTLSDGSIHCCSVCFDENLTWHSANGKCEDGHGWDIYPKNIKLIRKPKGRFDKEMVVEDAKEVRGFKIGDRVISLKDYDNKDSIYNVKSLKGKKGKIANFYSDAWAEVEFDEDVIDDYVNENVTYRIKNTKRIWFVRFNNLKKDIRGRGRFDREMVVEGKEI
jgi:hypothetical protein